MKASGNENVSRIYDRSIPLNHDPKKLFEILPRGLHTSRVFLKDGHAIDNIKTAFNAARRQAGIADFCFRELLRHALNNLRLTVNDYFRIMAVSGHKTMSVFKRYNLVAEDETSQIKWKKMGR